MKIVGLTYYFGEQEMVLKCDSCLLNGRKPMFVPDSTKDLRFLPVVIARISRLGKNIEARFADRYYDAIAPGADFVAYDRLNEARKEGKSWTQATGFDYSLAIGEWCPKEDYAEWREALDEAISKVSETMTIRQGDLIYLATGKTPHCAAKEDIIRAERNGEEKLYCKIK